MRSYLPERIFNIQSVVGDGHCLFRAIIASLDEDFDSYGETAQLALVDSYRSTCADLLL
jgi:hypothetical protein